jgi:HEPN domain-containing protein
MTAQPEEQLLRVRQWMEKADHDLQNAEHTLTLHDDDCPFDTVCFHAQQCAEKYLKGWLVYRNVDFPRTHDLVVLARQAEGAGLRGTSLGDVQPLNRYTIEARYPGDWEPIERPEAEQAVTLARRLRAAVRALFSPGVLPGKE